MFGRSLEPPSCDPVLGEQAQACFRSLMSLIAAVWNLDEADDRVPGGVQVWSLRHGAALLDIDQAIGFLPEGMRPTARDLAATIVGGLRP